MPNFNVNFIGDCSQLTNTIDTAKSAMRSLDGTQARLGISAPGAQQAINQVGDLGAAARELDGTGVTLGVNAGQVTAAAGRVRALSNEIDGLSGKVSAGLGSLNLDVDSSSVGRLAGELRGVSAQLGDLSGGSGVLGRLDRDASEASKSVGALNEGGAKLNATFANAGASAAESMDKIGASAEGNMGALRASADEGTGALGRFGAAHEAAAGAAQRQSASVGLLSRDMSDFEQEFSARAGNVGKSAQRMSEEIAGARRVATFGAPLSDEQLLSETGVPGTGGGPPRRPRGPGGGGGGRGGGGGGLGGFFGDMGDFAKEHASSVAMSGGMVGAVLGIVGALEPMVGAAAAVEAFKRVVKDVPALAAASAQAMGQFDDGVRVASQGIDQSGVPAFMRLGQAMLPFGEEVGRVGAQQMPNILGAATQLSRDATSGLSNLEPGFTPAVKGTSSILDSVVNAIGTPQMAQDMGDVGNMLQRPDVNRGVSEGVGDILHVAAKTAEVAGPVFGSVMDRMTGRADPWGSIGHPTRPNYDPDSQLSVPGSSNTYGTAGAMVGSWGSLLGTAAEDLANGSEFSELGGGPAPQNLADARADAAQRTGSFFEGTPNPPAGPAGPGRVSAPSTANTPGSRLPEPSVDKDFFKQHPDGGTFTDKNGNTITGTHAADGSMSFDNKYASGDAGSYQYDAKSGTSSIAAHSLTDTQGSFADATITRAGTGEQYTQSQDYNALTGKMGGVQSTEAKPGQAALTSSGGAPSLAAAQNFLAGMSGGGGDGGGGGGGDLKKYPPDISRAVFNEEVPEIAMQDQTHGFVTNDPYSQVDVGIGKQGQITSMSTLGQMDPQFANDLSHGNYTTVNGEHGPGYLGHSLGVPSQAQGALGQAQGDPMAGFNISHPTFAQFAQMQQQAQPQQAQQAAIQSALSPQGMLGAITAMNNQANPSNPLSSVVGQTAQAQPGQPGHQGVLGQLGQTAAPGNPLANVTAQTTAHGTPGNAMGSPANAAAITAQINAETNAITAYTGKAQQANQATQALSQHSQTLGQSLGQVGQTSNTAAQGQNTQAQSQTANAQSAAAVAQGATTASTGIGALGQSIGTTDASAQSLSQSLSAISANATDATSGVSAGLSGVGAAMGSGAAAAGASIGASIGSGASSSASTGAAAAGGAAAGAAGVGGAAGSDGSDSQSPSRKTFQIGVWMGAGLALGQFASVPLVSAAGAQMGQSAVTAMGNATTAAQTEYNTTLAGGFGAGLIAASNGVTPIAQDYGLMLGYSWAENVVTGAQSVFQSDQFQALTVPKFESALAQATEGALGLLPPAGSGAEYYTTTSGSAGMVQMTPTVNATIMVSVDGTPLQVIAQQVVNASMISLASSIDNQRG